MAQLNTPIEISLKNILVATDFSAASNAALAYVVPIARQFHSVVHIAHVIHPPEIDIAPVANPEISSRIHMDAKRQLELLETEVGTVPHWSWLREGQVSEASQRILSSHSTLNW